MYYYIPHFNLSHYFSDPTQTNFINTETKAYTCAKSAVKTYFYQAQNMILDLAGHRFSTSQINQKSHSKRMHQVWQYRLWSFKFWKTKSNRLLTRGQRYTYRVLQTIQMKLLLLCVWAEPAVLGSTKTALKFKYETKIG